MYTIGRTDDKVVSTPFIPKSERGRVGLYLYIHNELYQDLNVFWVDYKGNDVLKGTVKHGGVFSVQTYIGHPWTVRTKDTGKLVCHYIPYRIIQNTEEIPTVDKDEPDVGVHRFTIKRNHRARVDSPFDNDDDNDASDDTSMHICAIDDPVFPLWFESTVDAAAWSFQQMSRVQYLYAETLQKYLTNIVMHPKETKYRQIRIAQSKFFNMVWSTPARGLLLAAGFVEEGAYAELGSTGVLPHERVQDLSTLLFYLERWKTAAEKRLGTPEQLQQPDGADGYGRAGYGRQSFVN